MPIVNRQSDMVSLRLFGHPNILYLPSKLTGTLLYQTVDRVVPCLAYYSIHLTDGQVRISVKIPAIADMFSTSPFEFFTDRMPLLPPNQQHQSTEG